jgi:hypothetical protein
MRILALIDAAWTFRSRRRGVAERSLVAWPALGTRAPRRTRGGARIRRVPPVLQRALRSCKRLGHCAYAIDTHACSVDRAATCCREGDSRRLTAFAHGTVGWRRSGGNHARVRLCLSPRNRFRARVSVVRCTLPPAHACRLLLRLRSIKPHAAFPDARKFHRGICGNLGVGFGAGGAIGIALQNTDRATEDRQASLRLIL